MLACLVGLAIATAQEQSWWDKTSDRLRGVAGTCEKWGIRFSAQGEKGVEAEDAPVPGRLVITGGFEGPDHFRIGLATVVGMKQALAVKLGGVFDITPQGNSREATGGLYVEGMGLTAKLKKAAGEAMSISSSAENAIAKVTITAGRPDESPVAFNVHLGPLNVDIDPVKYAERLRTMGPEIVKAAGDKLLGGVSLSVDGGALAAALAHATMPPPGYYENRIAVSLRGVLTSKAADLHGLTSLDGVMFDETTKDVLLIGATSSSLPPIPTERLATVANAVLLAGLQPFISLDPDIQSGTWVDNRTRIGGVPDELRSSSLIQSMLTADYSMKRLTLGDRAVPGFRSLPDLSQKYGRVIHSAYRFWINPAPLHDGDVYVSHEAGRTIYGIRTTPVILTAPLNNSLVADRLSPDAGGILDPVDKAQAQAEADELTNRFGQIEAAWPESGFTAVRQDLEMTNVCSMLRSVDVPVWAKSLLAELAALPVPKVDILDRYPVITSAKFASEGKTLVYEGGVTSDVEVPPAADRADRATTAGVGDSADSIDLGPLDPIASGPAPMPANALAKHDLEDAETAYSAGNYADAARLASDAFKLDPALPDGAFMLVASKRAAKPHMTKTDAEGYIAVLDKGISARPNDSNLLWLRGYVRWLRYLDGGLMPTDAQMLSSAALADIERSIALDPTFADAYALRAQLEQAYGESQAEAIKDWSTAISADGKQPFYYYGRAGAYAGQSKLVEAKGDLDASLALDPNRYHALFARALTEQQLGDLPAALADATHAADLAPKDWQALDLLGQIEFANHLPDKAVQALTSALALRKPGDEERALSKPGHVAYPTLFERLDLWEDFVRFQGRHRDIMGGLAPSLGETVFDPAILYVRGQAEVDLGQWARAKADLTASRRYFEDEAGKIAALIATCDQRLASGG